MGANGAPAAPAGGSKLHFVQENGAQSARGHVSSDPTERERVRPRSKRRGDQPRPPGHAQQRGPLHRSLRPRTRSLVRPHVWAAGSVLGCGLAAGNGGVCRLPADQRRLREEGSPGPAVWRGLTPAPSALLEQNVGHIALTRRSKPRRTPSGRCSPAVVFLRLTQTIRQLRDGTDLSPFGIWRMFRNHACSPGTHTLYVSSWKR